MTDSKAKSNAEVARELVDAFDVHCGGCCSLNEYAKLQGDIESALATAQSQLAREVLREVADGNVVSHPSTSYQRGTVDGIAGSHARLRNLFTRLGVKVEG